MGQKMVRFSDLSGEVIPEDDALARIVVHEHPDLGGTPVEIEVLADEIQAVEQAAVQVAVADLYLPGEEQPRRVAVEVGVFDQLATDTPMSELLITARPARRSLKAAAPGPARGARADYASLESAGKPHKGKVTDAEKRLVREHFDEVNERLAAEGLRTISLADPEQVERYGLAELAGQRGAGPAQLDLDERDLAGAADPELDDSELDDSELDDPELDDRDDDIAIAV